MRPLVAAVALLGVFSSTNDATSNNLQAAAKHCTAKAGACFKVRGRMRAYDGYPHCRIWPVGTSRLLGVDQESLPSNVACGEGFEVYADFEVCPLTEAKPIGMQLVCVMSASNIRASVIEKH